MSLLPWLKSPLLIRGLTQQPLIQETLHLLPSNIAIDTVVDSSVGIEVGPRDLLNSSSKQESEVSTSEKSSVSIDINTPTNGIEAEAALISKEIAEEKADSTTSKKTSLLSLSWLDAWEKVQNTLPLDQALPSSQSNSSSSSSSYRKDKSENENEQNHSTSINASDNFLLKLLQYSDSSNDNSSEDHSQEYSLLMTWLEGIQPEHPSLCLALEKSGSYSFPICEKPFIACLLKHTGLINEAMSVFDVLHSHSTSSLLSGSLLYSALLPEPSEGMVYLWVRVKQLRTYLRQQRQKFKALYSSILTTSTPSPTPGLVLSPPSTSPLLESMLSTKETVVASEIVDSKPLSDSCKRGDANDTDIEGSVEGSVSVDDSIVTLGAVKEKDCGDEKMSAFYLTLEINAIVSICETEAFSGDTVDILPADAIRSILSGADRDREIDNTRQLPTENENDNDNKELNKEEREELNAGGGGVDYRNDFKDLCSLIQSRALFLLRVSPASNGLESHDEEQQSKKSLLNLMDHIRDKEKDIARDRERGTDEEKINDKMKDRDRHLMIPLEESHSGQERWKRVIEFLRVHSTIRKDISIDSDVPVDNEGNQFISASDLAFINNKASLSLEKEEKKIGHSYVRDGLRTFTDSKEVIMLICMLYIV